MDTLFKSSLISRKLTLSVRPSSNVYQQLSYEKEYLGLYISSHPLDVYKNQLGKLGVTLIKNIFSDETHQKTKIRVLAIVTATKSILTKKGELMLFATVEDSTGELEIIVFPRLLKSDSALWKEDTILCIDGNLSSKDETLKLLAEKAQCATDEKISLWLKQEDSNDTFSINVPPTLSKKTLLVLKEIASQHPGNVPLYLRVNKYPATLINTKMKVAVTPSFEEKIHHTLLNL
jgi:DNA polymerase-3 subunit alpha